MFWTVYDPRIDLHMDERPTELQDCETIRAEKGSAPGTAQQLLFMLARIIHGESESHTQCHSECSEESAFTMARRHR